MFGNTRLVSAFVPIVSNNSKGLLSRFKPTAMLRVSLTNGTPVLVAGDAGPFDSRADTEFVSAQGFAGELPVRVEAAVPFAIVRADYADLDTTLTIIACVMSGAFLVLALQYVRRSKLPAFDPGARDLGGRDQAVLSAGDQSQDRRTVRVRGPLPLAE